MLAPVEMSRLALVRAVIARLATIALCLLTATFVVSCAALPGPSARATASAIASLVGSPTALPSAPATASAIASLVGSPTAVPSAPATASPAGSASGSVGPSLCLEPRSPGSGTEAQGTLVGSVDSGRVLFGMEAIDGGGTFAFASIDSDGLHVVSVDDPSMAHEVWAPSGGIVFDSARADDRHLFH